MVNRIERSASMNITAIYTIGKLSFPSTWLAVLLAMLVTGIILYVQFSKAMASLYSDVAAIFILVWKFSVVLTDFSTVKQQPLALLYFNGGKLGVILGVLAVLIQLWRKRAQFDFMAFAWAIALTQAGFQIGMVLLNDNLRSIEVLTLVVMSIAVVWVVRATTEASIKAFVSLHLLVALIQPVGLLQQLSFWVTAVFVGTLFLLQRRSLHK